MTGHRRSPQVAVTLVAVAALSLLGLAVAPAANADLAAFIPGSALIDGDSVTTADGLTDANGQRISEEEYFAEQAGFNPTVVSGATWDSMTADQFATYQLLIVGDPNCGTTPTSATSNAIAWGAAVTGGRFGYVGNRVVLGTDPEAALLHGGGAAQPSGPPGPNLYPSESIDPLQSGSGRLVSNLMRFAGAMPDATGMYFDTSCADNGADAAALNDLSKTDNFTTNFTGFTTNRTAPCGATVAQVGALPPPYPAQTDGDLQGWGCSATVTFPTYPTDFQPLAIATDTTTASTCGVDQTTSAKACGQAYALVAGAGPVGTAPDISLTPTSHSSPDVFRATDTVTANVTQNGTPVAGQSVAFAVNGGNTNAPQGNCTAINCTTDANGNVSFTYQDFGDPGLTDNIDATTTLNGSTEEATAAQTWIGPDPIPVPVNASDTVQENTPTPITLQANDNAGLPVYRVLTQPIHGTLSGRAPALTYTPAAGYLGRDSFTFSANAAPGANSGPGIISITVTSNPVPIADDASDTVRINTPTPITLQGSDTTGDPLTYTVLSQPTNGTLSGTAPNLTYTPNALYLGPDLFTFEVTDGTVVSNPAAVSIEVTPPQPTADSASVSTAQNTPIPITLQGSGADGNALGYSVLSQPAHGTLSGSPPKLTYTPAAGYVGPDSFTFATFDGGAVSNPATISITVVGCTKTTPTLDTSVSTDQRTAASKFTSPAITTAGGNELLLAFVESDGPQSAQTITSVTGGGLQWTLAERANATLGTSEVWQAFATSPVSAATVTATLASRSYDGSITVAAFRGAGSTVGAVATSSGTGGGPTVTLTPSSCGSLIWASGHDWTNDTVPVAAGGQAIAHKDIDTRAGDSYWVQDLTTPTQPNTTVTIADTGPTSDNWGLAAVEVTPTH